MSFIGYSDSGYRELAAEIKNRKTKTLDILNSFSEVESAISDAWKGEDATAYKDSLSKYIQSTKETITEIYDNMNNYFERTYNDWVEKQRSSSNN